MALDFNYMMQKGYLVNMISKTKHTELNKIKANFQQLANYKKAIQQNQVEELEHAKLQLLIQLIQVLSEKDIHQTHKKEEENIVKAMGAGMLTLLNGFISSVGTFFGLHQILMLCSFAEPITLILSLGMALTEGLFTVGFMAWDLRNDFGINLFAQRRLNACYQKQIESIELIHQQLLNPTIHHKLSLTNLKVIGALLNLAHADIQNKHNQFYKTNSRPALRAAIKWAYLIASGALKFAGTFFLATALIGALSFIAIPTPFTIALGIGLGLVALITFIIFKHKNTHSLLSSLILKAGSVKEKMHQLLFGKENIHEFSYKFARIIEQRQLHTQQITKQSKQLNFLRSRLKVVGTAKLIVKPTSTTVNKRQTKPKELFLLPSKPNKFATHLSFKVARRRIQQKRLTVNLRSRKIA